MTECKQLSDFIKTALGEVGYLEKASNSYLDDKTKNAGSANYTKYGKWYGVGYNPSAWCAEFVSWCGYKAGASAFIPKHASCSVGIATWKERGQWHPRKGYTPVPGDVVYFGDKNGAPQHVEIVIWATADRIVTVGGNTSSGNTVIANGGAVAVKDYDINYSRILGYGHPDWPEEREEAKDVERYQKIADMPLWAQPHAVELCKAGALQGSGEVFDENGYPADLDISYETLRTIIILKRYIDKN